MAKLEFNDSAMDAGKTAALIQKAYSYECKGKKVLLIKSSKDTKGGDFVVSRMKGLNRKVDLSLGENDDLREKLEEFETPYCILIDEAQFLSEEQIIDLWLLSSLNDILVVAYGLRSDFRTKLFPGSAMLLALKDHQGRLTSICDCGKEAHFNARKVNGNFVSSGPQVAIDDEAALKAANSTEEAVVTYEPLCKECYIKEVLKITNPFVFKDTKKEENKQILQKTLKED